MLLPASTWPGIKENKSPLERRCIKKQTAGGGDYIFTEERRVEEG